MVERSTRDGDGGIDDEPSLVADGGERRRGKAAPPEDILAAPANQLDTEPHPQDITQEIVELLDATDTIIEEIEAPRDHGISPSAREVEQLSALADAIQDGKLRITDADDRSGSADTVRELRDGVRQTRDNQSIDSGTAHQLLDDLETAKTRQAGEFATTLEEAVKQLEQYQQVKETISSVSTGQDPHRLGRELARNFESHPANHVRRLADVGRTLETTASDLEECQNEHRQLLETAETVCATAATQTDWTAGVNDPQNAVSQLATDLEDENVWFADETTSVVGFAASVDATEAAQSKPATAFLDVLQNLHAVEDHRVREAIREAVEAIDRTETVTTRLEGVDPDAIVRTAERLLSDLDNHSNTVVPQLRERIESIEENAERSNDADLLTLYAARQELRYYDRTLIPQLSEPASNDTETEAVARRIEEIDDRRADMRQSYPSEYPDCDHTIPVYFFDLAATLLEEATTLQTHGKPQQAIGVADAAEQVLNWIEGMYETHSYFVLLKELRG